MSFVFALVLIPVAFYALIFAICEVTEPRYRDAIEHGSVILGWVIAVACLWNY